MNKVAVIIAGAGKGERFGGAENKILAKLEGSPIFIKTIEKFVNRDDVCQTILAVSPKDRETIAEKYGANLGFMGVQLVEGGETRCETIANALQAVKEEAEWVAVHDAVRPCVRPDLIDAVLAEAAKSGAAIPASPIVGTIKRVSMSMVIDETVSREGLYEAQTPQVFRKQLLLDAYARLQEVDPPPTDDAQLLERLGHPVAIVPSDITNLKITRKEDIPLASAILKARPAVKIAGPAGPFGEAEW